MHHYLAKTKHYWKKLSLWIKIPVYIGLVFTILLAGLYGVALWYQHKHHNEPLEVGTTFIASYAQSFGLDPQYTLQSIFGDLGVRNIRLVGYWEDLEPVKGQYDFSSLDWQMKMAEQYGAKVTLSIGLRQPRWPECHAPSWVIADKPQEWQPALNDFIGQVVNRYKGSASLSYYQLENEYFLSAFGECTQYGATRERLVSEYDLVKSLDQTHPIILSLADNYTFPFKGPIPDYYGISIYKRIYEFTVTKRNFEYPFPSWYYSARSGLMEIFHGRSSVIHELQAEPWGPKPITEMTIAQQNETMNADLLAKRFKYAEDTGMRTIYTWGAEWWLWRKDKMNDPSLWNTAKQAISQANLLQ